MRLIEQHTRWFNNSRLAEVVIDPLDKLPVDIILGNETEDVEGVPEGDYHLFYYENLDH